MSVVSMEVMAKGMSLDVPEEPDVEEPHNEDEFTAAGGGRRCSLTFFTAARHGRIEGSQPAIIYILINDNKTTIILGMCSSRRWLLKSLSYSANLGQQLLGFATIFSHKTTTKHSALSPLHLLHIVTPANNDGGVSLFRWRVVAKYCRDTLLTVLMYTEFNLLLFQDCPVDGQGLRIYGQEEGDLQIRTGDLYSLFSVNIFCLQEMCPQHPGDFFHTHLYHNSHCRM